MSKRVQLALHAIVSDDGTRCAEECPYHMSNGVCDNGGLFDGDARSLDIARGPRGKSLGFLRDPACIAAAEHIDGPRAVLRDVRAELDRWERSHSLACQAVASSMRVVIGDACIAAEVSTEEES